MPTFILSWKVELTPINALSPISQQPDITTCDETKQWLPILEWCPKWLPLQKIVLFPILVNGCIVLSSKIKNDLIKTLAIYSGFSGLADGQYLDLTFEKKKISKKKIIDLQKNKTGKLFAFCCECSGIIKQQNLNKRNILKKIGLDIGLLFQITDDLIDFKGDTKTAGKPTKRDKNKGKPNLVNLMGYSKALNFAKNLEKKINKRIKKYGMKSNDLLQTVKLVLQRKF